MTLVPALGVIGELVALGWLAIRARRIARRVRELRRLGHSVPFALDTAVGEHVRPRVLASAIAGEVSATVLGLTGWFRRAPAGFTMHRRANVLLVFGVFGALAVIETIVLHVVIVHWSRLAAFALTGLSIYGLVWMLGMMHAVRLAPLRFIGDELVIERGLVQRACVARANIAGASVVTTRAAVDLSYFEPNVELAFREPVRVRGLFGRERVADRVTISVDDPGGFLAMLER